MPACCQFCPTGASLFGNVDDLLAEAKKRLQYKSGLYQDYPVMKLDSSYTVPREVTPYISHIYGEQEGGGTQVLILANVPFEKLGLPALTETPDAARSEGIQHTVYKGMVAPIVFLGGLLYAVHKNTNNKEK
jgi:hypothetical protein